MPKGEKDDRFDDAELQDRVKWAEEFFGCQVKHDESIECQADRYVVDDGDVQIAAVWPGVSVQGKGLECMDSFSDFRFFI